MATAGVIKTPNINHVTVTVDPSLLQGDKLEKLRDFCENVLDWKEEKQWTEIGKHLVFRLYHRGHFLNLLGGKPRVVEGLHDHIGIEIYTREDLEYFNKKAKEYKAKKDPFCHVDDIYKGGVNTLELPHWQNYSFYVIYLLPLKIEFQYHENLKEAVKGPATY